MTPEEVISFIGHNYDSMEPVGDDGKPLGNLSEVRYSLTVHDLISAFDTATPEPEPLTRFCPGCGSVGPVDDKYRDCCPDGNTARLVPVPFAKHCKGLFDLALQNVAARRPYELVKAAEDVLEVLIVRWVDDGVTLNIKEKAKINALRIELNKFK